MMRNRGTLLPGTCQLELEAVPGSPLSFSVLTTSLQQALREGAAHLSAQPFILDNLGVVLDITGTLISLKSLFTFQDCRSGTYSHTANCPSHHTTMHT